MILKKVNKHISKKQSNAAEFREFRGQYQESENYNSKRVKENPNTMYKIFLKKCENFENNIVNFTSRDLVYYFEKVSEESGYKYFSANTYKDVKIMKWLQNNISNLEICYIIDFLYKSDQDYLDKNRLSPNILYSNWINTIYPDMKLWLEGKYKVRKKNDISYKEWDAEKEGMSENSVIIGDKL